MDKKTIKKKLTALIDEGREIDKATVIANDSYHYSLKGRMPRATDSDTPATMIKKANQHYYSWYYKARSAVRTLAPERLAEFEKFYTGDTTVKNVNDLNIITAGTTHYLQALPTAEDSEEPDFFKSFKKGFRAQGHILNAIAENIDHVLLNLEIEFQYGLSKSEIDIAKELQKNKHLRSAGAIAGVVIEGHLKAVVINKDIPIKEKKPTMTDYNDALKDAGDYSTATWRLIQRCGDIRNNCVHSKDIAPDEINDIIRAAEKIIAEVY